MIQLLRRTLWILGLICLFLPSYSQSYTISGYISDSETGEKLLQARVYDALSKKGTLTNDYGFFSLTLSAGDVELIVAYSNFQADKRSIRLTEDLSIDVALKPFFEVETVDIVAEESENIEDRTEMSTISIPIQQIKRIPAFLGEVDVVKAIQLLPGVQSGSEGTTGLYVRGGGPDQNLILLDGVPLYYVSHLGGVFSVFNADAISSVKLTKGGFPARYGGRLSSVVDVRMKEGNMKSFHGEGAIGLISSKLSLEGPIIKDKTSFIISGRRSYLDLLSRPITRLASDGEVSFGYYFYDLNLKINHKISDKDRIYLSGYFGDDLGKVKVNYDYSDSFGQDEESVRSRIGWGNALGALRWNHIWSPKLFSNLTATYTRYRFLTEIDYTYAYTDNGNDIEDRFFAEYNSNVVDWGLKIDFDFYPSSQHEIKFGANAVLHDFQPGVITLLLKEAQEIDQDTSFGDFGTRSQEYFLYIEDTWKAGKNFSVNAGIHASGYQVGDEFFTSIQPRLAMRYQFLEGWSAKASYSQMTQFLHLLTNNGVGLPTDLWVPATERVPPQRSEQIALGIATTLGSSKLELSVEGYYKKMTDISTYQEGASFFGITEDWQDKVIAGGTGEAYGIEVLLQKRTGKTTGWLGYTLSWNWRQFDELNGGKRFPYIYDRRNDLSLVVAHTFNERVSVSGAWIYGTGNAITLGTAQYSNSFGEYVPSQFYTYYPIEIFEDGRNGFRMRAYHRLDLSIDLTKKKKWGERTWSFSFYNAYSRRNPFFYFYGNDYDFQTETWETKLKQFSLFPIIPAFSYRFKF